MALSAATHEKIREEISHYPHARGALLYALHMARSETGALTAEAFAEIAPYFAMTPAEVAEVASFYPMYNLPPARARIQVCTNLSCCLRGARGLVKELEGALGIKSGTTTPDRNFSIAEVECLGSCGTAPVVQVNDNPYLENVTADYLTSIIGTPQQAIEARRTAPIISVIPKDVEGYLLPPNGETCLTLEDYRNRGGFQALTRAAEMAPKEIAELVKNAGLRGRGGAGFTTGLKWTFMPPKDDRPRYLAVNCDESEPGTFKDRQIMERNPFRLLEGIMIATMALEADAAFMYIRGEYVVAYQNLRNAIRSLYDARILGERAMGLNRRLDIHVQPGAGAYICGEESGMLESMEGKKGQPRKRPPFPAQRGLWSQPTTVNNAETLSHVPTIILKGADWFKEQGAPQAAGHTLFGISGHVRNPGVFELPMGVMLRDLIFKYAGGLEEGRTLKAIVPGGVSMPVLRPDQIDVEMDNESVKKVGTLLGTGGVVVMDDRTCAVRAALVIARFFEHESCGQCTQCREGTGWIYHTLKRIEHGEATARDLDIIDDCTQFMEGKTICAFSDAAAWAARNFLKQFRADFEAHVNAGACPFPESFEA